MSIRPKVLVIVFCIALCAAGGFGHRWIEGHRASTHPNEIYQIVWNQIAAVRQADYARAYQQVSSGFQEKFNIEAFADLARTDYPALLRADRVEFGRVRFEGRRALVNVYFILKNGEVVPCLFSLVHEEMTWKIDSARPLRPWPSGRR